MILVIQQSLIYRRLVKQFREKAVQFPLSSHLLRKEVTRCEALMNRILVQLFNGIEREYPLHLWELLQISCQHIPAVKTTCLGNLISFYSYDDQVALLAEYA